MCRRKLILAILLFATAASASPHPGGLITQAQITQAQSKLATSPEPWLGKWSSVLTRCTGNGMTEVPSAVPNYNVPAFYVDADGHNAAKNNLRDDVNSAFACAVAARIGHGQTTTDRDLWRAKARDFLNNWAGTNTAVSGVDGPLVMAYVGTAFLTTAELLVDDPLWTSGQKATFNTWVDNVLYPAGIFLANDTTNPNNTNDWGSLLALASAYWRDDTAKFDSRVTRLKTLIDQTIATNGGLPAELARTEGDGPIHYTSFALLPMTHSAWMIKNTTGENLFTWTPSTGGTIPQAIDYFYGLALNPGTNPPADPSGQGGDLLYVMGNLFAQAAWIAWADHPIGTGNAGWKASDLLYAVAALAISAPPTSAALGHHLQTVWEPDGLSIPNQQGWDAAEVATNRPGKLGIVSGIDTYHVGLVGTADPANLPYTLTNRGPANCAATNTCSCPLTADIDGQTDLAGLPTFTSAQYGSGVYLVKNCNMQNEVFAVDTSSTFQPKVCVWNSAMRVLSGDNQDSGLLCVVDSLINADNRGKTSAGCPSGALCDPAGAKCGNGSGTCIVAYTEALGGQDSCKVGSNDRFHKNHMHGYDGIGHHDGCQMAGRVENAYFGYNTMEGPWLSATNSIRFKPFDKLVDGGFARNFWVVGNFAGGGGGDGIARIGPASSSEGVEATGELKAWNNQWLCSAGLKSWDGGTLMFWDNTGTADLRAEGNSCVDGHTGWPGNSGGESTPLSAAQKTNIDGISASVETLVAEVRAAAGGPGPAAVTISSIVPTNPIVGDDVTINFAPVNFTPSGACTIKWAGPTTGNKVDTGSNFSELIAGSTFTAPGAEVFTVECPTGPIISLGVTRTFTAVAPTLLLDVTPGETGGSATLPIDVGGTISGTQTGLATAELYCNTVLSGTKTNIPDNSTFSFDAVSPDCQYNSSGIYSVTVTQGSPPQSVTQLYNVTISGGAPHNIVQLPIWIYDTSKPFGQQQQLGGGLGYIFGGAIYDRKNLGICPSFVVWTTEYPNIDTWLSPESSIAITLTTPTSGIFTRFEDDDPYTTGGDQGYYSAEDGVVKATCVNSTNMNTSGNGDYTIGVTTYDGNAQTGFASTIPSISFKIAGLTGTISPAAPTSTDIITLNYTMTGVNDAGCTWDMNGDGDFGGPLDTTCNETANTCTGGPLPAGNYNSLMHCNSGQVSLPIAIPVNNLMGPAISGPWLTQ